jgi:hypothetical protein
MDIVDKLAVGKIEEDYLLEIELKGLNSRSHGYEGFHLLGCSSLKTEFHITVTQ